MDLLDIVTSKVPKRTFVADLQKKLVKNAKSHPVGRSPVSWEQ
jgi:hypothetical protein